MLQWLKKETPVWFEITNLMIPTLNDDAVETRKLAEWILTNLGPDVPLHFTAFHPDFKLQDKPRTPAKTLDHARQLALDVGLRYVYEGNIYSDGANTHCPKCRKLLVRRSWHDVIENRLKAGVCPECGFQIAGVWSKDSKANRVPGRATASRSNYGHLTS
jgi:pyruvate formate lyase activating enzyme